MYRLALVLPGFNRISNIPDFNHGGQLPDQTIGGVITAASSVAIYVGGFMMFIWLAWGVFQYIIAEGNKENLAKARARIRWALLGFLILVIAFLVSEVFQDYIRPQSVNIKTLTVPCPTGQSYDPDQGKCI